MKHEIIQVGQIGIRFLLEAADTNGAVAMFEFSVPVGGKVRCRITTRISTKPSTAWRAWSRSSWRANPWRLVPGESCFIRRGEVHGFNNRTQSNVKGLAIITPALLGSDFFKEAAAVVNAGGPPDPEKLKVVLAKHGLVAVMPPVGSR